MNNQAAMTYIGAEAVFDGETKLLDSALIAGVLKGKITSNGHVSIEPTGIIDGELKCSELRVSGMFRGSVRCNRLVIDSQGLVEGEVVSQHIQITAGGQFFGRRDIGSDMQASQGKTPNRVLPTDPEKSNNAPISITSIIKSDTL